MTGHNTKEKLNSSSEEAPARASPSQESDSEWTILAATLPWNTSELSEMSNPLGSSTKMSPVSCHLEEDGTLVPSSGKWKNSGMGGPTESWTRVTSESPNDDVVSSLLDVLEEIGTVQERYYLSPKACSGILRRAQKRNKKLPKELDLALRARAGYTVDQRIPDA